MTLGWAPGDALRWLVMGSGIVLVDLTLSGDNALVVGAVASRLPHRQRLLALAWGGAGAIALRIALTAVAAKLLQIPLLQSVGAVIIMIITIRLLLPEGDVSKNGPAQMERPLQAILAIIAADASMSLDNVLAIAALAQGNVTLLVFGLLVSMVILLLASALIARLIARFNWLMDITALVLTYTAADLALRDPLVSGHFDLSGDHAVAFRIGVVAFTALLDVIFRVVRLQRARASQREKEPAQMGATPPIHPRRDGEV